MQTKKHQDSESWISRRLKQSSKEQTFYTKPCVFQESVKTAELLLRACSGCIQKVNRSLCINSNTWPWYNPCIASQAPQEGTRGQGRGEGGQDGSGPSGAPAPTDPWPSPALWPVQWPPEGQFSLWEGCQRINKWIAVKCLNLMSPWCHLLKHFHWFQSAKFISDIQTGFSTFYLHKYS